MNDIFSQQVVRARELMGEWVKEFRLVKGLTRQELADMLGVRETTISKIENGRWLSLEMLLKLSICLDFYIFLRSKKPDEDMNIVMGMAGDKPAS